MNSRNNDIISRGGVGGAMQGYMSRRNDSISMGTAMDDLQFNASLDALLDVENLSSTGSYQSSSVGLGTGASPPPSEVGDSMQPAQGLLTSSGTSAGFSLAGVPVGFAAGSTGTTPAAPSELPSSYATTQYVSHPGSAVRLSNQLAGHQPKPMVPNPARSMLLAPSDQSIATTTSSGSERRKRSNLGTARKRALDATAVSEDEGDHGRRRQDRNLREQQRSHKITEQIDHLRDVLAAANIQFKPDKYSTLVTVADYIKELQTKSSVLDQEHKKLLNTISRTNDMVNEQYVPASTDGENPPGSQCLEGNSGENEVQFAPNIDYKSAFAKCGIPLAVLSIDGRFLDCNKGFELLTGYSREELLPQEQLGVIAEDVTSSGATDKSFTVTRNLSLFNLLSQASMEGVFSAMSEMLKHPPPEKESNDLDHKNRRDYWSGSVALSRSVDVPMAMHVSLVRSPQGRAKFFDCSLHSHSGEMPF